MGLPVRLQHKWRGSLKLFSSLELQESPSEQDSPGPGGRGIQHIFSRQHLALCFCLLGRVCTCGLLPPSLLPSWVPRWELFSSVLSSACFQP